MNEPATPSPPQRPDRRRNGAPLFVISALTLALIVAVGTFYNWTNRPGTAPNQTPPTNAHEPGGGAPVAIPPEETSNPIPPQVNAPTQEVGSGADSGNKNGPSGDHSTTATVYRVNDEGTNLVPASVPLPASGGADGPMAEALNAMAGLKNSPLPPGTRAESARLASDGVATVNFNKALVANFPGGDTEEALVLNAILGTLAHFKGVERVQILVEGKKVDSLGGNEVLTDPLPVRRAAVGGGEGGGG
jgi:hypothetical protein